MSEYVEHSAISEQPQLRRVKPSDAVWDAFVDSHPHAHLLQTSAWAALKQQFGWSAFRVALASQAGEIAAGASILLRSALGLRVAYIPRGPLTEWEDTSLTVALFDAIEIACRQRGASVLKIEPGLPDTLDNRLMLERYGFDASRHTVQPQSTIELDISDEESAILKRMKSKWRYNIRLSGRKGVKVRVAEVSDLDAFNELMTTTGERDGFGVHSPDYYLAAYELLVPERAVYLVAEYEGEPLAAIVVGATGDTAWYLWGASSNRERNRMPNHALQWAGIQWARGRGATRYDLWGIPDDLGKLAMGLSLNMNGVVGAESLPVELGAMPREELWGVFRFKQGFGGEVVRDVGAWDKPIGRVGHRLYGTALTMRDQSRGIPIRIRNLGSDRDKIDGVSAMPESPVETAAEWRQVLQQLPSPHILQSWEWGEIKAQTGWWADRVVLSRDTVDPLGAYQFLWRELGHRVPIRIGYVPKGPVLDWHNSDAVNLALDAIEAHARRRHCIFVKMDPDVRSDLAEGVVLTSKLKRRGWSFSSEQIQFQNTAFSDLRADEEILMSGMKSKWRYNVRLARRRGMVVREGTADDLHSFYSMYAETGERDGFLIRPYAYYAGAWEMMLAAQSDAHNPAGGALLISEHEEEVDPVAGLFLMKYGDRAWYFYGASTDRRRRDMPNYLLQWEAMLWARENGCTVYDWWGAPSDLDDPMDSMQGVWKFKQGFGAVFQPHVGAWDYVTNPLLYSLYSSVIPKTLGLLKRWGGRGGQ